MCRQFFKVEDNNSNNSNSSNNKSDGSNELAKNLFTLEDALLLDNIEDKNDFGKVFNNITGLNIALPKSKIIKLSCHFRFNMLLIWQ